MKASKIDVVPRTTVSMGFASCRGAILAISEVDEELGISSAIPVPGAAAAVTF
jgi:hypothetical protein